MRTGESHGERVVSTGGGRRRRVVVLGLTNPDTGYAVLRGVVRAAREQGNWHVRVGSAVEAELSTGLRPRVDGALVFVSAAGHVGRLVGWGIPVVAVNFWPEAGMRLAGVVVPEEREVGPRVAEHLWSRGFRRFLYVGFDHPASHARLAGFAEAVRRLRGELRVRGRHWTWRRATSEAFVAAALRGERMPVGVFAFNDEIGQTVIDAAIRLGRRMPDEVAVVGADNAGLHWELSAVPLSSVDLRLDELGYRAGRRLAAAMRGEDLGEVVERVDPGGVVVRMSSDVLAIEDGVVADALRLVRSEACESLTAAEVIARAPEVSRSTLERRFRRVVGRSIGEEIRRVRLEVARGLVESGELSLTEVAARCGFSDLPHLTRQFTRTFGRSPSAWRREARGTIGPT